MAEKLTTLLKEKYAQNKKAFIVSVALGFIAALLVFLYLQAEQRRLLDWSSPVPVLIATQDIREMTRIDETMVKQEKVPRKFQQPGALSNLEEVVGQVTLVPVMKGEQIVGTKIASYGVETGLSIKVPKGMRALTIAVNDVTGVAGLLRPGNYVDLLAIFDKGDERFSEAISMTLLQNVLVLAVGQKMTGTLQKEKDKKRVEPGAEAPPQEPPALAPGEEEKVNNVTLSLAPSDAQRLVLAQEIGTLSLALRSPLEGDKPVALEKLTHEQLLEIKKPLVRRRAPSWREIRGAEQSAAY